MVAKVTYPNYCLLIRAQVPYQKTASDVLLDKQREAAQFRQRLMASDNPPRDTLPERSIALWFYKGTALNPERVATFAQWFGTEFKIRGVFTNFIVGVYFPNENDWYRQSRSQTCELHHNIEHTDRLMRVSRQHHHDPPGNNTLLLTNMHDCTGVIFDLSRYEICRGPRTGMPAVKYFDDGEFGQRVAILKQVKTDTPARYVSLDIGANLAQPFAMYARRM